MHPFCYHNYFLTILKLELEVEDKFQNADFLKKVRYQHGVMKSLSKRTDLSCRIHFEGF